MEIKIDNKDYILMIDDEDFLDYPNMLNSTDKIEGGLILAFSINDKESFEKIKEIKEKIINELKVSKYKIILFGTKKDLENERKISFEEAKILADSWGIEYIETSAKTNYNCKEVFEKISKLVLIKKEKEKIKKHKCFLY